MDDDYDDFQTIQSHNPVPNRSKAVNTTQPHNLKKYSTSERETLRFMSGLRHGSIYQPGGGYVKEKFSIRERFLSVRDFKRRYFSLSTLLITFIEPRTTARQRRKTAILLRAIFGITAVGLIAILVAGLIFHIVLTIVIFLWNAKFLVGLILLCVWGFRFTMKLEKLDRKSQEPSRK